MDDVTGTWVSPEGARVEVTPAGSGWKVAVFPFRKGGVAMGETHFTERVEVEEKLRSLEAKGYQRA